MEIKEYISSGIVELYAMDVLPPYEKTEFENKLKEFAELQNELLQVRSVLEKYVLSVSRNPRPSLRNTVLDKLINPEKSVTQKMKDALSMPSHSLTYKYLISASLAALIISTFASWFFYSRWNETEDNYVAQVNDKNQLNQNYIDLKITFEKTYTDLLIMRDENAKVITLEAADSTRKLHVRVFWNKYSQETFIDALTLDPTEPGKQYQLWALSKGQYFNAGNFDANPDVGLQRMKSIVHAEAWFITSENEGPVVLPNLEKVCLVSDRRLDFVHNSFSKK